jgi:hypothetical protein
MPQRILALDITDSELKAAVLETTFRDYRVAGLYREAIAKGDTPPDEQVRRFIATHSDGADTVLSALPGDKVTWRTFFLPFRDKKKLTQTVPFELENTVPFGLDEVVVDFQVLGRDRVGTTVLAALVPKRVLERHLDLLKEAGADPKVVDVGPLSTLNTLSLVPDLPKTFAFLDCSAHSATLALYREGQLVGLRSLSWSAAPPAESTNGGNHRSTDEAGGWLAELRWTLLALNGAPLDDDLICYVAGETDVIDAIQPGLEKVVGVQVRRLGFKLSTAEPKTNGLTPAFASSIGLALREVAPANALGINFRRGEFTFHRDQMEMSRALRSVGALLAVVVALWVSQLYMQYSQLVGRVTGVDAEIQRVVNDALGTTGRKPNAVQALQTEVDALRARVDLLNDVVPVSTSTGVDVLRAVSAAIPNRIRVDSEEYTMDPDAVRLRANTDTFESVDAIKQRMLETGFFTDVQVKDAKAAANGGGVDFRLVLELNKSPVPRTDQASAGPETAPVPRAPSAPKPQPAAPHPADAKAPAPGQPPAAGANAVAPPANGGAHPSHPGEPPPHAQAAPANPAAPPPNAQVPEANPAAPQAGTGMSHTRAPSGERVLPPTSEHVAEMEKRPDRPNRQERRRQRANREGRGGRGR